MQLLRDAALRTTVEAARVRSDIPGQQLAQRVAEGLRKQEVTCGDVYRDEPFWSFSVSTAIRDVHVSAYLYRPDDVAEKAIWGVTLFAPVPGLLRRLFSPPDESDLQPILEALHTVLTLDDAIWDLRWFKELPVEPYQADSYFLYPVIPA